MRYDENLNYNYVFSTEQSVGSVPGPYYTEYEYQRQALISFDSVDADSISISF